MIGTIGSGKAVSALIEDILDLVKDRLGNDGRVVIFDIVLRNLTIILDALLGQKVHGIRFLQASVTDLN